MAYIPGSSPRNYLRAWVRYDGSGRIDTGGPRLSRTRPQGGNWVEIPLGTCCFTTTSNPQ